jgi:hypothetical protein
MYYTYGHYKADTNELFYIGKGKKNRAFAKGSRSELWKNTVAKHGYKVEIFSRWKTEEESFEHEKLLISCFKKLTKLCNFTDGGEGISGYVWTEEQKEKLKLRPHANTGKHLSEVTRKKIGDAQRGTKRGPHSLEHSKRIALANTGKKKSPELVEKMRLSATKQAKQILTCTCCGHQGRGPNMYRYHFTNCKEKYGIEP